MNKVRLLLLSGCWLFAMHLCAQMNFKLQAMPDGQSWGVYVKPAPTISPTISSITGSGQITIIAPHGFVFSNFTNHGGTWINNATAYAPVENPTKDYFSFGFLMDNPPIIYEQGTETLLFSFKKVGDCPDTLYLFDNESDPFNLPNSENTNPGNELSVVDFGAVPASIYEYAGNYDPCAWNCNGNNCDGQQDTTVITPPDTSTVDTTVVNPPDTSTVDTTVVNPAVANPSGTNSNKTVRVDSPQDSIASGNIEPVAAGNKWFQLTPNPTIDWLTVTFKSDTPGRRSIVRLWSASGVALGQLDKNGETMKLNVGALPTGMYFLTLEVNGKVLQRERFVKM